MGNKSRIVLAIMLFIVFAWFLEPIELGRLSVAIDVADGTVSDWDNATVTLFDPEGDSPNDMTDLTFVAFDFDDTWLYVRWDIFNDSISPAVLYDMGINITGTGTTWDVFVSAQVERIGGVPLLTNISVRNANDDHIWNASDDGNMIEDGTLYLDPAPGGFPGNHSTEARFPLASLGIKYGVVFGQFRSHASLSVTSSVKDIVPDSGYIILTVDDNPPELRNLNDTPDPQYSGQNVNITVEVTDDYWVEGVWVNITYPDNSWVNTSMQYNIGDEWFLNITYDLPGDYSYIVWANDTSNNWNFTGPGNFTIGDVRGPEFFSMDDNPDPQENGGYVNVTSVIIDDVAVEEVWINITFPDSSWVNVSMLPGSGNGWFYYAPYDGLGVYQYIIWTNDTSDNWNSSGSGTFTIQDTDGPRFSNLNDAPDPQLDGDFVNITVDVVDDVGVDSVWVYILYPDGYSVNFSMDRNADNEWFSNLSYDDPGLFSYIIWANDTSNNWNNTASENFTILDITAPWFIEIDDTPDPQENGGHVNITAEIIDDVEVDEAWVNITYPNGSWFNASMLPAIGNIWFYNISYKELGVYPYTVWARDTSDNWNTVGPETFTIHDTNGPDFGNFEDTPDPQENGGLVNITVDVTDDIGVEEVWVNIRYPNGTWLNFSMESGSQNEWFFEVPYTELGDYAYTISASDTSNNWNHTSLGSFIIHDTDSPEIGDPETIPDEQEKGKDVNITVEVTDDVGIEEVWIVITFPDGSSENVSMKKGPDNWWYYSDIFDSVGNYSYVILAVDTSGNWNSTNPEAFIIIPPPEKIPYGLYMTLLFIFWPLLLIIFTVVLIRRYGFGNRFKKDIDSQPFIPSQYYTKMNPENVPSFNGLQDLINLSSSIGIPVEEFILAAIDTQCAGQIEGSLSNNMIDDLRVIIKSKGKR